MDKKELDFKKIKEGWERLSKCYILIVNKHTKEKRMLPATEGLAYMVGNRKDWEVEKLFHTDEEIAVARILYGNSN